MSFFLHMRLQTFLNDAQTNDTADPVFQLSLGGRIFVYTI